MAYVNIEMRVLKQSSEKAVPETTVVKHTQCTHQLVSTYERLYVKTSKENLTILVRYTSTCGQKQYEKINLFRDLIL